MPAPNRTPGLSLHLNGRASVYTCRRLWQYAVNAVLQDLGKQQPHKLSSQHLREWRRQRQRAQAREQFPAAPSVAATAAATAAIAPDSASKAPELDHSKPEVPKEAWKSTEVR